LGTEIRLAAFALLVVAGLWLIGDAMTYALHPADPASGKPRGCYTKLDLLLGVGPSESGILAGTRALELVMGIPLVLFGSARFARTFWRSRVELPLLGVVAAFALWKFGEAVFWVFHDADVFLTWRIIGNTPNELAERATAIIVFILGIAAVAAAYHRQRKRSAPSLRSLAYATAAITVLAALLLPLVTFPAAWMVAAVALVVLSAPLWLTAMLSDRT